jgi:NAD(P)-dependent dehydrogenase (short-subunit alcohol dehydrogenase family)
MAGIVEGKVIVVTGAGRGISREIGLLAARALYGEVSEVVKAFALSRSDCGS